MNMTKDKAHSIFCVNDIDLHGMHKGLEERVFQVRDDGAEWVDVAWVDQLLRSAQLDRVDERSHQVARWQDPLHDDQQVRVDLQQAVA